MYKNSHSLTMKSKNTPFEDLYNLLTYKSESTSIHEVKVSVLEDRARFSGFRLIKIPLSDKLGLPPTVLVMFSGYIDKDGNSTTVYSTPEKYKDIVDVEEKVYISKDIRINLKYTVYLSDDNTMMSNIKNKMYMKVVSSVESHMMTLYNSKRQLCFSGACTHDIKNLEEFIGKFREF